MKKLLLIIATIILTLNCNAQTGTVTDIDGNVYNTVTIGTQVWMKENLKTTKYNNGDAIATTSPANYDYMNENSPKYQWDYDGNDSLEAIYGRLYTWYAITDNRKVCPVGWHVPSLAEWKVLIKFLGGDELASGKLKEIGTTHWNSPNTDATNASGFTGLPGGSHWGGTDFFDIGLGGHFWSATAANTDEAWRMMLNNQYLGANTVLSSADKKIGWSVRCLNDTLIATSNIENVKAKFDLSIHPNPSNGLIHLYFGSLSVQKTLVEIYNLQGTQVFSKTFQNTSSANIDLTGKATGIYVVKVIAGGVSYEEKIVKE